MINSEVCGYARLIYHGVCGFVFNISNRNSFNEVQMELAMSRIEHSNKLYFFHEVFHKMYQQDNCEWGKLL